MVHLHHVAFALVPCLQASRAIINTHAPVSLATLGVQRGDRKETSCGRDYVSCDEIGELHDAILNQIKPAGGPSKAALSSWSKFPVIATCVDKNTDWQDDCTAACAAVTDSDVHWMGEYFHAELKDVLCKKSQCEKNREIRGFEEELMTECGIIPSESPALLMLSNTSITAQAGTDQDDLKCEEAQEMSRDDCGKKMERCWHFDVLGNAHLSRCLLQSKECQEACLYTTSLADVMKGPIYEKCNAKDWSEVICFYDAFKGHVCGKAAWCAGA